LAKFITAAWSRLSGQGCCPGLVPRSRLIPPPPPPLWNQRLTKGIPFDTLRIMKQFTGGEQREKRNRVASRGQEKPAGGMHWRSFAEPDLGIIIRRVCIGIRRDSRKLVRSTTRHASPHQA